MEQVEKLESDVTARESQSLEDVVKTELEKFVGGSLAESLEEKIKKVVDSREVVQMVGNIVKRLLGTKGKDGTIILVD